MPQYAVQYNGATRVEWIDPVRPSSKLTVSVNRQNKTISGVALNNISSLIATAYSSSVPLPAGCKDTCLSPVEKIAIRTTISGSAESAATVKQILTSHIDALNELFKNTGLALGFINRDAVLTAPTIVPPTV